MKIAIAQINSVLGDFELNYKKIMSAVKSAHKQNVDVVVFPEAALFGYHPVDLLERPDIVNKQISYIAKIQKNMPKGIAAMVGAITKNPKINGKAYNNSAVFIQQDKKPKIFAKQLLPTYDVFDEARHIEAGETAKNIFTYKGKKILVTICEDIWAWPLPSLDSSPYKLNPLTKIKDKVDLVINLSASPFTHTKLKNRTYVTQQVVKQFKAPMIYANMVGAQDELIFDGASFALSKTGKPLCQLADFEEDFKIVDIDSEPPKVVHKLKSQRLIRAQKALECGLRDFVEKIGFKKVHLGISGGIDSALVATIAARAIGGDKLTLISMPGPYNSPKSHEASEKLAKNLGAEFIEIPIESYYKSLKTDLDKAFDVSEFSTMHENLQARLRGMILMAYSNKNNSLLLNTSNKSEFAMGYSTLYGDQCGGLSVIGDVLKTHVFKLAELYNKHEEVIPRFIIDRPPSAELRPNQKDEDSLPPYEKLDPIITKLVENCKPARSALEKRVLKALLLTEFKRWQAPPILKITDHAFGRGRRLPVVHRSHIGMSL